MRFHQSRPQRPLLLWSAPRMRTQASSKPGSPLITDFRLVYPNSEIGSNSGCYRYKNGLSLRLCRNWPWHDSVFLALTQRKVGSGDEIGVSSRFRKPCPISPSPTFVGEVNRNDSGQSFVFHVTTAILVSQNLTRFLCKYAAKQFS